MKSIQLKYFLAQILLLATGTLAQSETGIPQFSTELGGVTLSAAEGSEFTSVTATWNFQGDLGYGGAFFEFYTQYVAIDVLPTPDNFEHGFPPPLPLPPLCSNSLQVGTNTTTSFAFIFASPVIHASAFYIWNGVTNNITDASGNPLPFVSGETVTVTLNANTDKDGASFTYDSNIHGVIVVALEGDLCLNDVSWAIGSSTTQAPPFFPSQAFSDCSATEVDTTTGAVSILGPNAGVGTTLASAGGDVIGELSVLGDEGFSVIQPVFNGY